MLGNYFRSDFGFEYRVGFSRALIFGLLWLVVAAALADPERTVPSVDTPWSLVDIEQFLPVRTQAMRRGALETQTRPTGVAHPFFLIGCDSDSLAWLERNRERLIQLGAFGLVIEAPDIAAYRRLEVAADGLMVRPVSGDLIAEHLRLESFPVLITAEGLFQSDLP